MSGNPPTPGGEPPSKFEEECKLQRTTCVFAKVGEGCKTSILCLKMDKHKKESLVKHVDLLYDSNKELHSKMNNLFSTVNTSIYEHHLTISNLQRDKIALEKKVESLQERMEKMERQMAVFSRMRQFQKEMDIKKEEGNMETPYLPVDPSILEKEKEEKKDEVLLEPGKVATPYLPRIPSTQFSFDHFNPILHKLRYLRFVSFWILFF